MATLIDNNRWSVGANDFAARIIVPDLQGLFSKILPKGHKLVIEPGTRALVIDEGVIIGEVPPGEYTLESFLQRLNLWRNKQTTIFLTRSEDVPIETPFSDSPCMEGIFLNGVWQWVIQMNDVLPFMENLMGAKESLSIPELSELISPMMNQALRDVLGETPYERVTGPDFTPLLLSGIRIRVDAKLKHYGLLFQGVHSFQCDNKEATQFEKKKGDLFLKSRETQLQAAVGKIKNDRLNTRLDEYREKLPIREALRDVVSSDKIDKLQSNEDFKKAVGEIDKQRLLRKEEVDTLTEGFNERKEDREKLREHILATLDRQREQDLDSLRLDLDHEVRMREKEKEIEVTRLSRSGDAEEWRAELERDKEEAQHRWQQKHERVKARWGRIRE
ncbi:MAG: hypothetical protein GY818_23305, partial [Planctomycetaceae bacterium]|nr:hypothetical protein [Planctomycetaceae bacterium]